MSGAVASRRGSRSRPCRANRPGAGAGVMSACTFLGGSIGVAGGAIAYPPGGFPAVAGAIGVLSLAALLVCRRMPERT